MQAAFVDAFVSNGGHKTEAAIEAGYSKDTARSQAYELLAKPHVIQAIMARTMNELVMQSPVAVQRLHDLLSAKSEYVRLQAAQDVLNRVGLKAPDRVDHRVHGDVTVNIDLS
jgi:phage terminase small subunit